MCFLLVSFLFFCAPVMFVSSPHLPSCLSSSPFLILSHCTFSMLTCSTERRIPRRIWSLCPHVVTGRSQSGLYNTELCSALLCSPSSLSSHFCSSHLLFTEIPSYGGSSSAADGNEEEGSGTSSSFSSSSDSFFSPAKHPVSSGSETKSLERTSRGG